MGVYFGHYDYNIEWSHYECDDHREWVDPFNDHHHGRLYVYDSRDDHGFFGPHNYCLDYFGQQCGL
jgi:phosphatidylserine/phosphatidylglycerophosphate/cardiolipin synthase-like enzyme